MVPGLIFLLGLSHAGWGQTPGCPPGGSPGDWSKSATYLVAPSRDASCRDVTWRDIRVYSPDHSKALHIVEEKWWVEVGKKKIYVGKGPAHCGSLAEMAWAPDNMTFYITEGVGGLGPFDTRVYRTDDTRIEQFGDINLPVRRLFDPKHGCPGRDENGRPILYTSDVAGFKWFAQGNQLLVVAEAAPDNTCANASNVEGYLVALPQVQILEQFTFAELRRRWGNLFGEHLNGVYEFLKEK